MPFEKYFTTDEANSLVPELLEIVPLIQEFTLHLRKDYPDVALAQKNLKMNGGSQDGSSYLRIVLQLNRLVNVLTSKGCVIKGLDQGLIDFPTMREGREVFLCWKNPESEITHWHDLDAGYAGRQKL
tara:strand:+ start:1182 stop:1562 length:381 start_codon:yes stop_codon:yes gene_type:complete